MESLKFAIFLLFPVSILGLSQQIVLYSGAGQTGSSIPITETSVSDLSTLSFDNTAVSICAAGTWLLYNNAAYNPDVTTVDTAMMYMYGYGPSNYKSCLNLPSPPDTSLAGQVSSVRYVGVAANFSADSITLYVNLYFQGPQFVTVTDIADISQVTTTLNGNQKSLIITGSSSWTVCPEVNYGGTCTCIATPPPSNGWAIPAFCPDLSAYNITYGTIKSFKKGC